jgi:hypothetical protein
MEPLGVLIYGYSENDSKIIKTALEKIVNNEIIIISGSEKENMTILDILNIGPGDNSYLDTINKIIVFLGFDNNQINEVLQSFPKNKDLVRPIFCGLTEQNINWPLSDLVEHLLEEDKRWSKNK